LQHWKNRAQTARAPVLAARYNDLVWDLSKLIANERRHVDFARRAIDAYVALAGQDGRDLYYAVPDAKRALALAIQIDDKPRLESARAVLLLLHRRSVADHKMWWAVFDALEEQPKSGLTESERSTLIADFEAILVRVSDTSDATKFDPHAVESVADKLIPHYRSVGRDADIRRMNLSIARAFEHFGGLADPMLASVVLQTSMDAYTAVGEHAEAHRILGLIEKANVASIAQMTRHEHRVEIPADEVEKFLAQIVVDSPAETFRRIAGEFLLSRKSVEDELRESASSSPLQAMIGRTKLRGDRVVASIGSIDDDPIGRLIDGASDSLGFSTVFLSWAIDAAIKRHSLIATDFVDFVNSTKLFGDGRLLSEGISAWLRNDYIMAAHVLVPQVEAGFRTLLGRGGRPTTKPHPQMKQARMVTTFGDMLTENKAAALGEHGPDIVLHFRALYADPRGNNLRNELAHGLASIESINAGILLWVIHSLLLLGAWLRPTPELPPDALSAELPSDGAP
jgi:lysyl-tRNA synthetase class 1